MRGGAAVGLDHAAVAFDAGLKLGDQNEVSRDAISARRVTEQDPHAGTTVEEGTAGHRG